VIELVTNPRSYKELLTQVLASHPELIAAVTYFRELMDPNSGALRSRRTDSFRNKLLPFQGDPTLLAAFASPQRGIDWERVAREGRMVLIDARGERDADLRQFKLLWWFRDFVDYIKYRGMAGRGQEITFLIDEVTQLLGYRSVSGQSLLAEDFEELTAVLGRNYGLNTVISHQNMSQVDPRIQNVLLQMGTQCVGTLTNDDDAIAIARALYRYNPSMVRKYEPIWMNVQYGAGISAYSQPQVIDHRSVEYTMDEQVRLSADSIRSLPKFTFLLHAARYEGDLVRTVKRVSIERADRDQYPDHQMVNTVRSFLRVKSGVSVAELLAALEQGRNSLLDPPAKKKQAQAAILKEEDTTDETANNGSTLSTSSGSGDAAFKEELWNTA
jgi:hypothetical protein